MRILELFCDVDDFCQQFWPQWEQQLLTDGTRQRRRTTRMASNDAGLSTTVASSWQFN